VDLKSRSWGIAGGLGASGMPSVSVKGVESCERGPS
jgi:hypothetical protein